MLPNTVTTTLSDGSTNVVLTKRSEQGGTSKFTGSYTSGSPAALREIILEVRHTRPTDPTKKGSSLCKVTLHVYDADGLVLDTIKSWQVVEMNSYKGGAAGNTSKLLGNTLAVSAFADEFYEGSF